MAVTKAPQAEFVITPVFDAPREQVWKGWTGRECLAQRWGPRGLEMQVSRFDLRPGGVFHYRM